MEDRITLASVHHFALRVTDLSRSIQFYSRLFGFQPVMEQPGLAILTNGRMILGLRGQEATSSDRFDEFRVGLDHISFGVGSRDELEQAARVLDERGVPHGEIEDQGHELALYVMAFRDPDNIQLELTAPYS